jgi:hypothetical protein
MFHRGKAVKEAENEARNMVNAAVMKNLMAGMKSPNVDVVFASSGSEGLL